MMENDPLKQSRVAEQPAISRRRAYLATDKKLLTKDYSLSAIIRKYINGHNFAYYKGRFGERSVNLIEFIEIVLVNVDIEEKETILFVAGVKRIFENICHDNDDVTFVTFKMFINFVIKELNIDANSCTGLKSYRTFSHNILKQNMDKLSTLNTRDVKIFQEEQDLIYINIKTHNFKTNAHLFKTPVKLCIYDYDVNIFILTLEEATEILVFDHACKHLKTLSSKILMSTPEARITSICFSNEEQRVS